MTFLRALTSLFVSLAVVAPTLLTDAAPPPPPKGKVNGDPHYCGADGSKFDFTGVPGETYCMISDSHLHINVYHGGRVEESNGRSKPMTWIRQMGIMWASHVIELAARKGASWQYENGYMSSVRVNGQKVSLAKAGESQTFADGAIEIKWVEARVQYENRDADLYEIRIKDVMTLLVHVVPENAYFRTGSDALVHFNVEFAQLVLSDSAHGVLGQTYRSDRRGKLAAQELVWNDIMKTYTIAGDNAEGFLDGETGDYKSTSLSTADCKMSRFAAASALEIGSIAAVEVVPASAHSSYVAMISAE